MVKDNCSKVMPLEIKAFIKGICMVCQEPCNAEGYIHSSCAVAYMDIRNKKIKENLAEWESNISTS